ncbi:Serine/threonine-protein kinase ATR [Camellia lanceoleosa]|uniref:Serine/threonine-protein kinase ATR n=1 Tax=Camellia lanceoleosa TaxID=1840588 RepID=A0ACC0G614_9ERIC|nr:Serine/threonine-protein kinase ATR [Camellia lanceoleosa]
MANLSSLVHELRERIVASSLTPPNIGDDDALEIRFHAVLPNLLHAYVVPSSSANEREVIAVLKLLTHRAKNFPRVFFHGRAAAVLPLIVGSLLSLLRTEIKMHTVAMIRTILVKIDSGSFVMERFVVKRTPKAGVSFLRVMTTLKNEPMTIKDDKKGHIIRVTKKFIYLEDVLRFMLEDEALKTMSLLGGSPESEKISQSSLKNWVTLNDTKTAVNKLHHMVNVLVVIVLVMVVEEMNILTIVFLRLDNQKIIYLNSILSTKPISNYSLGKEYASAVLIT